MINNYPQSEKSLPNNYTSIEIFSGDEAQEQFKAMGGPTLSAQPVQTAVLQGGPKGKYCTAMYSYAKNDDDPHNLVVWQYASKQARVEGTPEVMRLTQLAYDYLSSFVPNEENLAVDSAILTGQAASLKANEYSFDQPEETNFVILLMREDGERYFTAAYNHIESAESMLCEWEYKSEADRGANRHLVEMLASITAMAANGGGGLK
jgi:hypothetical protein